MPLLSDLEPGLILSIGEAMLELSPTDVDQDQWAMGVAGDTLNTAWYLRALLPRTWQVGYVTRLGLDGFSQRIADFISAAGIETSAISRDPIRGCGLYAISLQDGERSFTYWRGQSAARHLADAPAELAAALASARLLFLSGITLAILPTAGRAALLSLLAQRRPGTCLAFDPNIRPGLWPNHDVMCHEIMAAASLADIMLPSFDDEAAWFGDRDPAATLARYLDAGASEVVVKNGTGPILAGSGSVEYRQQPEAVTPRDTTGAGDSFNGGYLAARLSGADFQNALCQAARLAARVVRHKGALLPQSEIRRDPL